jgi:alpha-tubulin suppressor-like RCC1 family protein
MKGILENKKIIKISSGGMHSLAITQDCKILKNYYLFLI